MNRKELRKELHDFVENKPCIPEQRSAMFKLFFQNGEEGKKLFKRALALREQNQRLQNMKKLSARIESLTKI